LSEKTKKVLDFKYILGSKEATIKALHTSEAELKSNLEEIEGITVASISEEE